MRSLAVVALALSLAGCQGITEPQRIAERNTARLVFTLHWSCDTPKGPVLFEFFANGRLLGSRALAPHDSVVYYVAPGKYHTEVHLNKEWRLWDTDRELKGGWDSAYSLLTCVEPDCGSFLDLVDGPPVLQCHAH